MKNQTVYFLFVLFLISCKSTPNLNELGKMQPSKKPNTPNRLIQSENVYTPELFKPVDGNTVSLPEPDKIDLADFYFSNKNYDESFNIYSEVLLDNAKINLSNERWLQTAVRSIVVAVRIKKDQSLALEFVSALFDSKVIPESQKITARYWQKALKNWRNEADSKSNDSQLKNSMILAKTEKWLTEMKSAKKSKEYFLVDRLRISAMLDYLMSQEKLDKKDLELMYSLAELNSAILNEIESASGPVLRSY